VAGIIRCPAGHTSRSAAKVGGTTSCPACRADGRGRVSCRVHPDTAPGPAGVTDSETAHLAAAWAAELPHAPWHEVLGEAAGQDCPGCAGPMRWTGAGTALICPKCRQWSLPPAALDRAAAAGAALERRASRAVAVSGAQARAGRVRIRAIQDALAQHVERLLDDCDPDDYDKSQDQRAAFEIGARLRAYLPEIRDAGTEHELSEVHAEVQEIRAGARFAELVQERGFVAAARASRQAARERAIEQQRQIEKQREADQRAAERQAAINERQAAVAIERRPAKPPTSPYVAAVGSVAVLVDENKRAKLALVRANGACGFKHRMAASGTIPADRFYGVLVLVWGREELQDSAPSIRACRKHFAAAAEWMAEQGYPDCTYWDVGS
jgi:hypothetical protein